MISLIIPMRNEERFVASCLDSLLPQLDSIPECEVLCIDGASTDRTREIVAEYAERDSRVRLLFNPKKIVPTAMNIGLAEARGDLIIRLDCHAHYDSDYVRNCLETAQRTGADNVGGIVFSRVAKPSRQATLVQALTTQRFGVGDSAFRVGAAEGPADTVPFGCFRRQVFERIGCYDERLVRNQDYELNRRLLRAGGRIWLNPAIQAHYYNQDTVRGLLRQASFTGHWNPWMWYVAPYAFAARHLIPALFVLGLALAAIVTMLLPWGWALLAAVAVPYLTLALLASVQQARRYGWWMLPILPVLFLAYHLSYGIGILWGVLLLLLRRAPVQGASEPWPGAGRYRAWPNPQGT